jgi:phosphotransferase system enzyme I (PtsI)
LAQDIRLVGIPVSPGVAHGPLVLIDHEEPPIPSHPITPEEVPAEIARFEAALLQTREQILKIREHLSGSLGEKDASIFDAHLLVVEDSTMAEAVKRQLASKLQCVEYVYHHITSAYAESMRQLDDPYLKERAADIEDIGRRVINNLMGRNPSDIFKLPSASIILSHDLSPGDTAMLDRTRVLGFVTEAGSRTSHTAIMARSLKIPGVVGLKHQGLGLESGIPAILDGHEGVLIINPSEATKYEYGQIELRRLAFEEKLDLLRETTGLTKDNRRVFISANVELPEDLPLLKASGAEGIGLHRTEFMFLNRLDFPSEEEQVETYIKVIEASKPHPPIIRTLDIGGDKLPRSEADHPELNPFLGFRAIRYCLEHEDVFRTQLRAICRAGRGEKVRILFPMIATIEELLRAKAVLQNVRDELYQRCIPQANTIETGIMIEVPSAALIVEHLIPHADFLSIGTNDLVQYTMAVDRTNEKVAPLYQPTHPAVMQLIKRTADAAHAAGKWVGVCGEVAGEISLTPMLLGLGIDELSMGSVFVPRVKKAVQSLHQGEMAALMEELIKLPSAVEIYNRVEGVAKQAYPDLFD